MSILIPLCLLILLAYIFDISSARTKIPSFLLLLILGFSIKLASSYIPLKLPDLFPILPILGSIGLILIVLEGAIELEINTSKIGVIKVSSIMAIIPIIILGLGTAYSFTLYFDVPFKIALANAIPLSIISSAIAIPSSRDLNKVDREFITYESSLSDIFGVILFNFVAYNEIINGSTYWNFIVQLFIMLVVSLISSIILAMLIANIKHRIKFLPIIVLVILIYSISKEFHLPALLFIMIFGLAIHNLSKIKSIPGFEGLETSGLEKEVVKFTEITTEFTFLIRILFFLLFGYLLNLNDILNVDTLGWSVTIVASILILRYVLLRIFKLPVIPLIYLAPRGLVTILLVLSIPANQKLNIVSNSLLIQIILILAIILMFGFLNHKNKPEELNQ